MLRRLLVLVCLLVSAVWSQTPSPTPFVLPARLGSGWNGVAFSVSSVTNLTVPPEATMLAIWTGTGYDLGPISAARINAGAGTKRGFWVFSTGSALLEYSGTSSSTGNSTSLVSGWNLISTAQAAAISATELTQGPLGQTVMPIFYGIGFPPVFGQDVPAQTQLGPQDMQKLGVLLPGVAYWVYATAPTTLTWDTSPPLTPSPSPGGSPPPLVTGLSIVPAQATGPAFAPIFLKAEGTAANGSQVDVTNTVAWSTTAQPQQLIVTEIGTVIGLATGTFNVSAALQGFTASCLVTVTPAPSPTP